MPIAHSSPSKFREVSKILRDAAPLPQIGSLKVYFCLTFYWVLLDTFNRALPTD